jgi:hypothetical protein
MERKAYLDMLLQVLGTLEALSTEVALVWLEWNMDADMGGDMVTFDSGSTAEVPTTCQIQVVGALPSNMAFADMLLYAWLDEAIIRCEFQKGTEVESAYVESLWRLATLSTLVPLTGQVVV